MKTIHLIRHADTLPGTPDIDRALSQVGHQECVAMVNRLRSVGFEFAETHVSIACRARETAQSLAQEIGHEVEWQLDQTLYTFQWPQLLTWLESRDEHADEVTLIGHNPAVSELAEFLTGERMAQVPTCSFLKICAYVGQWRDLYRECGQLVEFLYPGQA